MNDPQDGIVWDGRYRIAAASPEFSAGPPASPLQRDETAKADGVPDSLRRLAAATHPALTEARAVVSILAPWARYLPSFDLAPASAVAELIGAPQIPAPPFREHIESKA